MSGAGVSREMVGVFDVQLNLWQVLILVAVVILLLAAGDRLRELMSSSVVAGGEVATPDVGEVPAEVEGAAVDSGAEGSVSVPPHDLLVAVAKVYVLREFIGSGLSGAMLREHKEETAELMRDAPDVGSLGAEAVNAGCALLVDFSSEFFVSGRSDFPVFLLELESTVVLAYQSELAMHKRGLVGPVDA